jgi:putative tryptophan/tyrosine transport system substrate-binding protein
MYIKEQGVLQSGKLTRLFTRILLLFFVTCITSPANAKSPAAEASSYEDMADRKHVFIIASADNTLQTKIIGKITERLKHERPDIEVIKVAAQENIKKVDNDTDLVIGIGATGMKSADTHYPEAKKLFISTDPNKYRLDKSKNKNDAILYMTQSYCRQLGFIKLLNRDWSTVSILSSQKKPIDRKVIQQCANNYDIKIYIVSTTAEDNVSNKIKHALHHSDVLLALPDSNIYNSNTVKNILLTSYRYRKPVIGFSKNFVTAGALAGIYSDTEQIAQSACKLIEGYYDTGLRFTKAVNHPEKFDMDINRQVFKALDLSIPDVDTLRKSLEHDEAGL